MGLHTALADQPQIGQALEQWRFDPGALAYQNQRLSILQTLGQSVHILDVIVPDGHVMACQFAEALKSAQRIVIVIQDRDFHEVDCRSLTVTARYAAAPRGSARRSPPGAADP